MYYPKKTFCIKINWQFLLSFYFLVIFFVDIIFSQHILDNTHTFENQRISKHIDSYYHKIFKGNSSDYTYKIINTRFYLGYINNDGHSNVDNNGRFYASAKKNLIYSLRLRLNLKYLLVELEPYQILRNNHFNNNIALDNDELKGTYRFLNNHNLSNNNNKLNGIKNSQIIAHYKGFGIGYGFINQWWGPGIHSSITLSSNSSDIKTYSVGTFREITFKNFSLYSKLIISQKQAYTSDYKTANDPYDIFISGINSYFKYFSNPEVKIGFNRLILSNNYPGYLSNTSLDKWNIRDSIKPIFQPIFSQSNIGSDQSAIGSPGFDPWNQLMSAYVNLSFPKDNLDLFIEVASDDKRANLSDFLAHWDHTIGYLIGFNKSFVVNNYLFYVRGEYLNTLPSNTTNPKFYRGSPYIDNFYSNSIYDYSTFENRRLGAHSGSSSDDSILYLGVKSKKNLILFSFNVERHGVKSTQHHELKREISFILNRYINKNATIFFEYENEKINNFGFIDNNTSISNFVWFGYSHVII